MSFAPLRSKNGLTGSFTYPLVTTQNVTNILSTSGDGNGKIINSGNSSISARGFVYSSVTLNPTLSDSVAVEGGTATGTFTKTISGLSSSTTYYVRAYATNAIGTGYGDAVSFTTSAAVASSVAPMLSMMGMGT